MMFKTFFLSLLFLTAGVASAIAQKTNTSYENMATEVLHRINKHRADIGLKPLVMNSVISRIAAEHSTNMGQKKTPFGHDGMNERVTRAGKELKISYSRWGENVANGQKDAADVVAMWLESKGHRENIEGDYNLTGIGIAKGKNGSLFFTQIFIKKSN